MNICSPAGENDGQPYRTNAFLAAGYHQALVIDQMDEECLWPDISGSSPPEQLLLNPKDNTTRSLSTTKLPESHSKTRIQSRTQRPKIRSIPKVNEKQSSSHKLGLEVQFIEKQKSSRRKSKRNTESILTPLEYHNQVEDLKNSDEKTLILSDIDEEDVLHNLQRRKTLKRNQVAA
jgi:hypothetical protein